MVKPTDQEAIDIEKVICYSFQEDGTCHTMGKDQGWSGGRMSKGKIKAIAFIVLCVGRNSQGQVSRLKTGRFE